MIFRMKELLSRLLAKEEKGQTLIEYALIILLVSIVVIAVLGLLGTDITAVFDSIRGILTGSIPAAGT